MVRLEGNMRLLCPCSVLLPIRFTAYGALAVCPECNVRWTVIREQAEGIAAPWVAERR